MRRFATVLTTIMIAVFGVAHHSRAGLLIELPTISVTPGTLGEFDVLVFNNNPMGGGSYNVAGFSLELSLAGPAGVMFTGVDIATTAAPYLFHLSGTDVPMPGSSPLSYDLLPTTTFMASDAEFAAPYFNVIAPGETYGLAHVYYVADATAGSGDLQWIVGPGTSFSDINGNNVIPEPSSWVLLLSGFIGTMAYRRFQNHRFLRIGARPPIQSGL